MKESKDGALFDGFTQLIRAAVREELKEALNAHSSKPPKLLITAAEASELLSVPKTWLEARAREGKIKSVRAGHYRLFAIADLQSFIERSKQEAAD